MLSVLRFSDGEHSLLDIADRSGLRFASVRQDAKTLLGADLLAEAED